MTLFANYPVRLYLDPMNIGILVWGVTTSRGGLERVGVDLAHSMVERGHTVTIFFHATKGALTPLTSVSSQVRLCPFHFSRYNSLEAQAALYKKALASLLEADLDVLALLVSSDKLLFFPSILAKTGIPLVISEHNDPRIINTERWNSHEHYACLATADRIHTLLHAFVPLYPEFLHERITVIPNAITIATSQQNESTGDSKTILAAGRFAEEQKQFSLLIEAFALLAPQFPDWKITLCGEGPDANRYRGQIAQYGLQNRIILPGSLPGLSAQYATSSLVCMPSRYEGFGLVAAEAGCFGLPVVGFAECSGVNEIIIHGENGLLAQNMTAAALAEQLAVLMADEPLRCQMGQKAQQLSSRFASRQIFAQWEQLLCDAAASKDKTRLQQLTLPEENEGYALAGLKEILERPAPFYRPGTQKILARLAKLEAWQSSVRKAWWYRLGFWVYKKFSSMAHVLPR